MCGRIHRIHHFVIQYGRNVLKTICPFENACFQGCWNATLFNAWIAFFEPKICATGQNPVIFDGGWHISVFVWARKLAVVKWLEGCGQWLGGQVSIGFLDGTSVSMGKAGRFKGKVQPFSHLFTIGCESFPTIRRKAFPTVWEDGGKSLCRPRWRPGQGTCTACRGSCNGLFCAVQALRIGKNGLEGTQNVRFWCWPDTFFRGQARLRKERRDMEVVDV